MSARPRHHLVLVDRGLGHVHRWGALCTCGRWSAVPRRRKRTAKQLYRAHVEGYIGHGRRRPLVPGPPTPYEELPEVLR